MSPNKQSLELTSGPFGLDSDWTFEHALLLLNSETQESAKNKTLSRFFVANKPLLLSKQLPFAIQDGSQTTNLNTFELRSQKYNNTLSKRYRDFAEEISKLLKIDVREVVRILQITLKRIPDEESLNIDHNTDQSTLEASDKNEVLSVLGNTIMKERRTILNTVLFLVKQKRDHFSEIAQIVDEINANAYQLVDAYIQNVSEIVDQIEQLKDHPLDSLVRSELSLLILDILNVLSYLILKSGAGFTKTTVAKWFQTMEKTSYLASLSTKIKTADSKQIETMESLCTVISLVLLDLDFNFGSLSDDESFMNDPNDVYNINTSIFSCGANSIVLYAWSIILHRKHVVITENPDHPVSAKFSEKFQGLKNMQMTYLSAAYEAERLDVCAALINCHHLLSYDNLYAAILSSFVIAFVPYIQLTDQITLAIKTILNEAPDKIVERFFLNPATEDLMAIARAKLPISLKSFLRLVNINSNLAFEELHSLKSYMEVFNEEDFYYKYSIDDGNPDLIKLTQDVDILPPYETSGELSLLLKDGTRAQILPGGAGKDKLIVAFLYDYNGWSLLGRILKNLSKKMDDDTEKTELLVELFELMTRVVNELTGEAINDVLQATSAFVDDHDILEIVFRVLDQALHLRNVQILEAGMNLLTALTSNGFGFRVWSYLYKSQLLGFKANGGLANTILGTVEMVNWHFEFTLSLLKLTSVLIDDCVKLDTRVTHKLKSEVIDRLVAHLIYIFENFIHWRYANECQRLQIGAYSVDIFSKILHLIYGIDESSTPETKVTKALAAACGRITASFLAPDIQFSRSTKPIMALIKSLSSSYSDHELNTLFGYWQNKWVHSAFEFSSCLISVRSYCQSTCASAFELDLYSNLPCLVDIYSRNLGLRQDVITLLSSFVNAKWESEPPSLLTHLRQKHSQILLRCLAADLSNELESFEFKVALYDFFSSVMEGDQEGLSIVFITGRNIKEWLLDEKKTLTKQEKETKSELSLLKILKRNVSKISEYPSDTAIHLVDALALAFNSWITAKEEGDDQLFIENLIQQLAHFPSYPSSDISDHSTYVEYCYQVTLLSKVAEILSLYLFVSQNDKCKAKIYEFSNSAEFMSGLDSKFEIVRSSGEQASNSVISAGAKWSEFQLSQFAKSFVFRKDRYGAESLHSFALMDTIFQTDPAWKEGRRKAIIAESLELQVTTSQITTAKSFGALVTCVCKTNADALSPEYLKSALHLLQINDQEGVPTQMFESIYRERIELAFFICLSLSRQEQRSGAKLDDKLVFSIITTTCQLLLSSEINLLGGLVSLENQFYKPLLRILLIGLGLIREDSVLLVEYSAMFSDIFMSVIVKALKTLFGSIQNQAVSYHSDDYANNLLICKQVEDVSLVISTLKAFLQLRLPRDLEVSIARAMVSTGSFRSILNLYSCSHLVTLNKEEVFADFALSVLNELVGVKVIAEKLIANGLFSVLTDSPVSVRIQRGNVSPVSHSKSRLHHLWTNGLLPIVLTLTVTFGERIMPELYLFVSAFQKQFQSTILGWLESNTTITTSVVQETSQIILLAKALNALDAYDLVKNANPKLERIKLIPGLDTKEERINFVTGLNYLVSHPKFLSLRVFPSSLEEQRLLESGEKGRFIDGLLDEIKQLKDSLLE